jgi:hypothetical protein
MKDDNGVYYKVDEKYEVADKVMERVRKVLSGQWGRE